MVLSSLATLSDANNERWNGREKNITNGARRHPVTGDTADVIPVLYNVTYVVL
jgi:hypothetical protein